MAEALAKRGAIFSLKCCIYLHDYKQAANMFKIGGTRPRVMSERNLSGLVATVSSNSKDYLFK